MVEVTASSIKAARTRTQNYNQKDYLALCDALCAISMDAMIGTDQIKTMFWEGITDFYNSSVDVQSTRTQGSLGHRWSTIHDQCSR